MYPPDFEEPLDPDSWSKKLRIEIPESIRKDVEQRVAANLPAELLVKLRDLHARGVPISSDNAFFHFGGGMAVRNLCRERLSDDQLAACQFGGDWDNCYIGVLAAIGAMRQYAAPGPSGQSCKSAPVIGRMHEGRYLSSDDQKQADPSFPDDASADPAHHTQDKTVHLFSNENYRLVEARLGVVLPRPTFGENLTTTGTLENNVYVGDHFRVGKAVICVTQPTERCKTIGRSLGVPTILKALHELELCGFYARVVRPGSVDADDIVELCERPQVAWSIKRLHQIMFRQSACIKLCFVNFRTTNLSIKFWPSVSFQPNGRNDSKLCEDGSDAASR